MTKETERLIERLGLQDGTTKEIAEGIIFAIGKLSPWKFSVGIHTLYVRAIEDVTESEHWTEFAKKACNHRTLGKPLYKL